jgi:hypothetical protein
MDNVRPVDVTSFIQNGVEWVRGRSGGKSTFASASLPGRGKIWRLPQELPIRTNYIWRTTMTTIGHGSPRGTWKPLVIALSSPQLAEALCDNDTFQM